MRSRREVTAVRQDTPRPGARAPGGWDTSSLSGYPIVSQTAPTPSAEDLGSWRLYREVIPMTVGGGMDGLNAFLPDGWLRRPTDTVDDSPEPDTSHYPYARPLRGGWQKQLDGKWECTIEDQHEWEVICEQCGDRSGRVEDQPESARELRGPYDSKHKATHVAKKHFDRFRTPRSQ